MRDFFSKRKWLRNLLLLVGVLLLIEFTLRGIGSFLRISTEAKNKIQNEDASRLRILAVGESTTADSFSKDDPNGAWPRQLEVRLRENGINARVYNEGMGGTESVYIVSRLRNFIDVYQPHIVISMMGANDGNNGIRFDESTFSAARQAARRFRLIKLGAWAVEKMDSLSRCTFDYEKISPEDDAIAEEVVKIARGAAQPPLEEIEKSIRMRLQDDKRVAMILHGVALRLGEDARRAFIDRAFELYPYNYTVAAFALNFKNDNDPEVLSISKERYMEVSNKIIKCGRNIPDLILLLIAKHPAGPNPKLAEVLSEMPGFSSFEKRSSHLTYHYRLLHDILRESGIRYLAMQYPTLPLADVKRHFSDASGRVEEQFKDMGFISNEENFRIALEKNSYDAVFIDRSRGSWGHSSKHGNSLIASAAQEGVLQAVESDPHLANFKKTK